MENDHHMRGKPTSTSTTHAPKKSDLMSSAKVMADAAKSALAKDTEKIDKAKVAGATADLLGAAKHYGKLEENNFGKYVGKAETYLHQYHSSHATTPPSHHASSPAGSHGGTYESGEGKHGHSSGGGGGSGSGSGGYGEYVKLAQGLLNKKQDHGGEGGASHSSGGGGGAGDYIKLAQGLLNKKQGYGGEGGNNGHSSGGGGDYIKLAQGFLKKH